VTAVRALFPIDNDPAAAGDIRAMADPDAVMSPLPGLVSNPCGLRAPHSFRYGPHYSAPGGAQKLQGLAYFNAYGGCWGAGQTEQVNPSADGPPPYQGGESRGAF